MRITLLVPPKLTQIARSTGPTWGPSRSCRPHMAPCWPHEPCYQGSYRGAKLWSDWIIISTKKKTCIFKGFTLWAHNLFVKSIHNDAVMRRRTGPSLVYIIMMTSSNGNIFRVTGHLCGEFTGPRWIPRTKASDAELWCFLWSAPE